VTQVQRQADQLIALQQRPVLYLNRFRVLLGRHCLIVTAWVRDGINPGDAVSSAP
jgi:hypothetical protein